MIVFFKIDRLARSTVDFAEIMKVTQAEGVALASASEPLDLTSSMGRAMVKVIAVFAELESDTIGMSVSSAHEPATGGPLYGRQSAVEQAAAGWRCARSEAFFCRVVRGPTPSTGRRVVPGSAGFAAAACDAWEVNRVLLAPRSGVQCSRPRWPEHRRRPGL